MPRITFEHNEYTPKPVGVLKARIIDNAWYPKNDREGLPNLKSLHDPDAEGVIEWHVMPDGHDRMQKIYTPIKLVMKDGEVSVKDSYGITAIHGVLEGLGLQVAGFTADGTFVDEKDKVINIDDMSMYLIQQISLNPDFRVVVHVYKEKSSDGKHYFRTGRYFYQNNQRGIEACTASVSRDLEYQQKKEEKSEQPAIQPITATSKMKRL